MHADEVVSTDRLLDELWGERPPATAATSLRNLIDLSQWWQFVPGANWRHPSGPADTIEGKDSYPVVDVSDEPMDGNPAHSTISIARGTLTS